jgi:hypothetical protein
MNGSPSDNFQRLAFMVGGQEGAVSPSLAFMVVDMVAKRTTAFMVGGQEGAVSPSLAFMVVDMV